ncbi:MAG: FAD binding domain-containing protein [Dehalococcoidia bacterium]
MARFDYVLPESLSEAVSFLKEYGDSAKVVAGGQSLMVMIRNRLLSPEYLVGLERIAGLNEIRLEGGRISIGAGTTYRSAYETPEVRQRLGVLASAAEQAGPLPIRNMGTVIGSVCHNAPGADVPPALLVLDARAHIVGPRGEREIALVDLFTDIFATTLQLDEVVDKIIIPEPPAGARGTYLKFSPRLIDMSVVGVAVLIKLDSDGVCRECRIAIGGVADTPYRAHKMEELLVGSRLEEGVLLEAGKAAAGERELLSDIHASAEYRKKVMPVMIKRAVHKAIERG